MTDPTPQPDPQLDLLFRVTLNRPITTNESTEMAATLEGVLTGLQIVRNADVGAGQPARARINGAHMTSWAVVTPDTVIEPPPPSGGSEEPTP